MEITKENAENQMWRDLPLELLRSVMVYLEIKDNIRASVVCKSWYEAAVSVRIVDQSPWRMYLCKINNTCEFYDPSNYKEYTVELPKSLLGCIVHYSKDGWLLMSKHNLSDFVLFNPFTMDLVVLPYLRLGSDYQLVGFSCAPTSSDCVVFTIKDYDPGHVTIRTWSPSQTMWTSMQVDSQFLDALHNKIVFSNGVFYCLNQSNCLAVFNPSYRTWNVLDVPPPRYPEYMNEISWNNGKFMVSYEEDIFFIITYRSIDPLVFKLDLAQGIWEKKDTLGGLTIFASSKSCESKTYVNEGMLRNSVCFPTLRFKGRHCVAYSFTEGRYHMDEDTFDWRTQYCSHSIWIQPPKGMHMDG